MKLIAIDIDGVLNGFAKYDRSNTRLLRKYINGFAVQVYPDIIQALKELIKNDPSIKPVWLTTWVDEPKMLTAFEGWLGLTELNIERVPSINTSAYSEYSRDVMSPRWWKLEAWDRLLEKYHPEKAVWIDDDLEGQQIPLEGDIRALIPADYNIGMTLEDIETIRNM